MSVQMHFEERATQEESRVPLRSRNVALTSSLPNIVDPELAALRRRHHFAPQQRHHHPHFQYGEMTEEVSAPQHRDAQYRYRLKAKQSLLVPKSTSTQEVHRSVTYMPQFPPQNTDATRPAVSSFRKRHVTFSSREPQFHEPAAATDGRVQAHQHYAPPSENKRVLPRAFSHSTFQHNTQDQAGNDKHLSSDAVIQYDDDEDVVFTKHPHEILTRRKRFMDKPPSSDKEPNSDDEEHFIDGNYFFNHLVRNKAAEDYNMAEMLRERSRELQKNHWLFSHSHNRYLRPHQQYGAYETDRLSTSLPADYPNKPPNYFYYQDDGHRIVSTESRNRHFDLHNNRRHQGPRHRDIPFAGGLEIEIPPRRHGGLGGGGLRQSISADRLLMVPHTHRDSAKFGRHYFRAGPSYDHNTSFSSYSATNLDVLPLHIETHVPHDVDVDQTASRLKGRTVALEHRGETDSDVAVLPDTKEHNHFRFSKRLPHNMFNDRPLENRYTGQETRHIANTGRYNVPTGRFEPVTGSHPYPKSGSNSDMLRSAVLNQYQSNSIPNSSSSLARDSSRTQFIADNERRTAYFQQNDSKLPSVQGTNHSIRKDFGTRTVVRVIGTEGVQNTHFRMNNRDNRGQAISSGGFHAPMKYSSMGNRTWNEHFHEGLNRDFPSADPRMSVSWDSSRFRAHSDKHYNQPPHWSHQQSHVFQRPFDVVDSSQSRPKHMDSVSFQNVQDSHEVQRANVSRSQHFDTSGRKVVTWQDQDLESDRLVRTERDVGEIQPILDPGNYGDGTFSREPSHSVIKDGGNSTTNDSLLRNLPIVDLQNVDQFALFEVSMSKLNWTESFMGTNMLDNLSQYKFVVLNRHEEVVFVGTELDESMSDSLMSPHKSSFKVRILDANGQDVIHFRRLYPLKPMRNFAVGNKKKYRLEVATPSGHVIGNVEKTYDSDTYYILEDRTGECLFLVQKSCICTCPLFWDYEFKILLPEGEAEVGEISWSYLTAQNEQFNGTEISFPIDLNTTSKLMLLGVCFLLNFSRWPSAYLDSMYNERRRKDKLKLLGPKFLRPQEGNKEITALLQTSPYDNGFYRNEEDLDYHSDITRGGVNVSPT